MDGRALLFRSAVNSRSPATEQLPDFEPPPPALAEAEIRPDHDVTMQNPGRVNEGVALSQWQMMLDVINRE